MGPWGGPQPASRGAAALAPGNGAFYTVGGPRRRPPAGPPAVPVPGNGGSGLSSFGDIPFDI